MRIGAFRGARWLLVGTFVMLAPAAHADAGSVLSRAERHTLLGGETVARPMRFEQGRGRYMGGVAYQLVPAAPAEVVVALLTVSELPLLLPRTKAARLVDVRDGRSRVELVQGNSVVQATYTLHLDHDPGRGLVRFWMDRSRPHDIDDVWGYFRAQSFGEGQTLLTVAVALDVGDGLVRWLFEDRIERAILGAPRQFRDYLEPRALATSR